MKLVIAEKPSVGRSIANVLGVRENNDGYLKGNGYIVSWCFGHLVTLAPPEQYDEKYKKWNMEDLPIIPKDFLLTIKDETKTQFNLLKKLMNSN